MQIEKLYLQYFRNYTSRLITFKPGVNVLIGKNAVGKTNVLEAVYLLATGESFRAQKIDEMVAWNYEVTHLGAKVVNKHGEADLKVILTRGIVAGEKARKRQFLVNDVARQKQTFTGNLAVVAFLPADLQLISGTPGIRRRYMDGVLSQVDKEYARSLQSYEKGLRRRNKLLDMIREGQVQKSTLVYWDHLLIREGAVLTDKRREWADFLNEQSETTRLVYDYSAISEGRLAQYEKEEVMVGYTMVGPHKDDFSLETKHRADTAKWRDLATYGSRGEQRMGVLWLKKCEMAFTEGRIGEKPVLLLDDIFSELDSEHEALVWQMAEQSQTIITTSDELPKTQRKLHLMQLG